MELSELEMYPKIKNLLVKYDAGNSPETLSQCFRWKRTEEGLDFWGYLNENTLEDCKEKYPKYFTEEFPKINLDYLLEWPVLHKRASYIAGYAKEGDDNIADAARSYYRSESPYADWEGTVFWDRVCKGRMLSAMGQRPDLFDSRKFLGPHSSAGAMAGPEFVESPEEEFQELVDGPKEKGLSLMRILLTQITSLTTGHGVVALNYRPSSEELFPVMSELGEFFEESELNWSCEARYKCDGSGSLYIRDFWKRVEDSPSGEDLDKIVLSWGG